MPFDRGIRADKVPVITDRYVQGIGFDNGLRKDTVEMHEVIEVSAMFAAGISSAMDVPRRPFSWKRLQQSRHYNAIFGPSGSATRHDNDPFVLARTADPTAAPFFFLTCGEQEGLLPPNSEFADLLAQRRFRFEFHTVHGGHDWNQWNAWLPAVFRNLAAHMQPN